MASQPRPDRAPRRPATPAQPFAETRAARAGREAKAREAETLDGAGPWIRGDGSPGPCGPGASDRLVVAGRIDQKSTGGSSGPPAASPVVWPTPSFSRIFFS